MSRIKPTIAVPALAIAFAPAAQAHHAKTQQVAKKKVRAHTAGMRCTGRRSDR